MFRYLMCCLFTDPNARTISNYSIELLKLLKMRPDAHDSYRLATRCLCISRKHEYPSLAAGDTNRVFVRCIRR